MKSDFHVLPLLNKLKYKDISREELNTLISISARIAKLYLIKNYHKLSGITTYNLSTQDENAMDAVASLFCMDSEGKNHNIVNSMLSWSPPINSEEEALFFINKMAASRVDQYISEMLKESDPVFAKIYNSLNYVIRKKGYVRTEFGGCRYIVRKDKGGFEKDPVTTDAFEAIPAKYFRDKEKYADELFNYIESLGYEPAIPVNLLVSRLKRLYLHGGNGEGHDLLETIVINEAIQKAKKETEALINEKYFAKGKLTAEEKENFIHAAADILNDLKDGGLNPGLQKYLEKYIPDLNNKKDYDRYQNILEYLLKIMKKTIAQELRDL